MSELTHGRQVNVLLVDDHPESLTALEAVLSRPNYNLIKAQSGEEALRALLKLDFALILLDVRMPDLSGFDIARLIRQREKNRNVPIIFVTGFGRDTDSITEGYLSGAVDYLLKPVDPDILRAKAAFFIDLHIKTEALKLAGQYYKQLETSRVIVWRADSKTLRLTYVSAEMGRILGYPLENWTMIDDFWSDHIHPDDKERVTAMLASAAQERSSRQFEYRIIAQDGTIIWFQNLVHIPQEEIYPTEIIGVMLDISERKEAEETIRRANEQLEQRVMERTAELRASLNEKEVLLKEIHHRVKNNLQVISSLLNLQKSKTKNPDVWNTLNDSQNRVRSMALIHEKLYETKDLARVDFGKYINDLAAALLGSYGVATDRVKLHIRSDVHLDIDTAIPCGLIVNELISNALKYAFPDAGNGEITIDFTKDQSNYSLTVQDNGVGFPKDRDFRTVDSLGMRLVNTLTRQLEGSIDMENASGTTFRIFFPEIRPAFHNGSSYNGARKME